MVPSLDQVGDLSDKIAERFEVFLEGCYDEFVVDIGIVVNECISESRQRTECLCGLRVDEFEVLEPIDDFGVIVDSDVVITREDMRPDVDHPLDGDLEAVFDLPARRKVGPEFLRRNVEPVERIECFSQVLQSVLDEFDVHASIPGLQPVAEVLPLAFPQRLRIDVTMDDTLFERDTTIARPLGEDHAIANDAMGEQWRRTFEIDDIDLFTVEKVDELDGQFESTPTGERFGHSVAIEYDRNVDITGRPRFVSGGGAEQIRNFDVLSPPKKCSQPFFHVDAVSSSAWWRG